ncbi:MAG: elongation factor Ts [Acidobacteria bacterium]|nr:elongation factor Ts [Acidobacteriota bacterium]
MEIGAAQVKQLRDKTGAGFMDCKLALEEAAGNVDDAIIILRKKGLATAAKKAGRTTKEGAVAAHITENHKVGVLVEVNCETDFVAKTDPFKDLVQKVAAHIAHGKPGKVRSSDSGAGEALLDQELDGSAGTWEQFISGRIAQIGENIVVRRFSLFDGDYCQAYIHAGGRVGTLVELSGAEGVGAGEVSSLARDLAMHVAAADPRFVRKDDVTAEDLAREREIYREQAVQEGKPAGIIDKIVEGRLSKFYSEVCLYDQAFIRDPNVTVAKLIASRTAGGSKVAVKRFARYRVGEGE